MTRSENNPLLEAYQTPFGTHPFDKVRPEHYEPAYNEAVRQLHDEIERIAGSEAPPTFRNTIVALEQYSGILLHKINDVFFNVLNADATDEMIDISQRISPKLSASSNDIYLNERLFERVKAVYDERDKLNLSTEDARLLDQTYDSFKVQGAGLDMAGKEAYRRLTTDLNLLTLRFEHNVLKDKKRFELLLTDEEDLEGLPESALEAALVLAEERGKTGWLFSLATPSYTAFMRYSSVRRLREHIYREYMSVGSRGDEFDNKDVIRQIVNIRLEIARLIGYDNYAGYALHHTMAKSPGNVYALLDELLKAYRPVAVNEYHALETFARSIETPDFRLMPWDWSYYSDKLKDMRFHVNDEMTRPYFELENVKNKVFGLATQLYGITFKENKDIPVYHPDVNTYEVYDVSGDFLAILYTDFHPREGKQSGAWMNSVKPQFNEGVEGEDGRPHVIIVMNFTPPTHSEPSLLTYDEVSTLLHEFGHALHGILSDGSYVVLTGTSVYHDFVELPSQIMENWLREKDFLDQIAVHYKTGEKIPQEYIQRLVEASNFNTGFACCRQLSFGLLDMAWHTIESPFEGDPAAFEQEARKPAIILPQIKEAFMSGSFAHIFSGEYAAGYYGYKWAEVLEADAFSVFKSRGIFNTEVARSFRDNILSKGGSEDPEILYERFRGQKPTIDALLIKNGTATGRLYYSFNKLPRT
ncbi:MAG: M3 family metallopeptidase [Tannerellaceae bacterium]|jgi:peptidyl-dipeptidase Dcp|nr:M3 family metallopeptidase [Tannerellaceae bacterium]